MGISWFAKKGSKRTKMEALLKNLCPLVEFYSFPLMRWIFSHRVTFPNGGSWRQLQRNSPFHPSKTVEEGGEKAKITASKSNQQRVIEHLCVQDSRGTDGSTKEPGTYVTSPGHGVRLMQLHSWEPKTWTVRHPWPHLSLFCYSVCIFGIQFLIVLGLEEYKYMDK